MIEELLRDLTSTEMCGMQRRVKFEETYFKIGLLMCDGNINDTADYLGYSAKAVQYKIKGNFRLKKLKEKLAGVDYVQDAISKQSPCFLGLEIYDNQKTKTIHDLCRKRIDSTREQAWFKRETVAEQINIVNRIKVLYDKGEPSL